MEKIRTFIAVPLPDDLINEIGRLIDELSRFSAPVKWVKPRSVHLTLKFLGNLTPEELEKVFRALDGLFAREHHRFTIRSGGAGVFPSLRKPRVLWVGLQGDAMVQLHRLQQEIEQALAAEGFAPEKRDFSPHLTIGRVKMPRNLQPLLERFLKYSFPERDFPVHQVLVMRSELHPDGARYSVLKAYHLPE